MQHVSFLSPPPLPFSSSLLLFPSPVLVAVTTGCPEIVTAKQYIDAYNAGVNDFSVAVGPVNGQINTVPASPCLTAS